MRWQKVVLGMVVSVACTPFSAAAFGLIDDISNMRGAIDAWNVTRQTDLSDVEQRLDNVDDAVFSDVPTTAWYADYVSQLSQWHIISGYRDTSGNLTGEFKPANLVTVGEALKMSLAAARVDVSACGAKTGTGAEHWAAGYARCGKAMGMKVDLTNLDAPALRWGVIMMLTAAYSDTPPALLSGFTDVRGHPAESAIAYAALRGIVSGDDGSNRFRPDDTINRAEVAKIIVQRIRLAVRRKVSESF